MVFWGGSVWHNTRVPDKRSEANDRSPDDEVPNFMMNRLAESERRKVGHLSIGEVFCQSVESSQSQSQ